MKEVIYGYRLRESKEQLLLAQQWVAELDGLLGNFAPSVSAEWDRNEDGQVRPVVTLRLSDYSGSVTTVFEPKELESADHMRLRLNRLWSDLLRIRSHHQLRELLEAGRSQEGD